jgi:ADP-ribose pyrophosphatase YjhB (NUDIX family)
MRSQSRVTARPGGGLGGDRYATGTGYWSNDHKVSRDLTLIEAEAIEAVSAEIGEVIGFAAPRRNIVTRGVRLNDLVGARFRIGRLVVEGTSLCEPCAYLARITGKAILRPFVHRGGLRANILTVGEIAIGDPVDLMAPMVGVGVVVSRNGRYLLGLRRGGRGHGTWSTPGGSVLPTESVTGCAIRELREETGLIAENPRVVAQAVNRLDDGIRWDSVFVAVDVTTQDEPRLAEPDKCARWGWFEPGLLPKPLFPPVAAVMRPA